MGREEQFSYEGLGVLFDYLESYEDSTGEQIYLDVIALCCDYTESTIEEIIRDYSVDIDGIEDDEIEEHVLDYLNYETTVCGVTDSRTIVYQQF
jgi:hypothetical protein